MGFCLPKDEANKFKEALTGGKIVPEKLMAMTSAERRAFFEGLVGKENAQAVNALLESKLILQDQKRGMVTWAKNVAGLTPQKRTDLIARIEKLDKALDADDADAFLEDLAAQKLGAAVTFEEAQNVLRLTREAEELRGAIPDGAKFGSNDRMAYGLKMVELQNYIRALKTADESLLKDLKADPVRGSGKVAIETLGFFKSALSALDNSFFGRQGIKVLYTTPSVWGKAFAKSFGDIRRELIRRNVDIDPMDLIKADIYSRPNALNGLYERSKVDIGIAAEEAFPSSLPAKIPVFGRFFKASETAFQGAALRMRADLADRLLARAEEFGVDIGNAKQAEAIGKLINSMTGRGGLGSFEAAGRALNVSLFSPKFLTSNLNTLTLHRLGASFEKGPARTFAVRQAATNLAKIVGYVAAVMATAEALNPGSVEFDPRSSKFGKIKLGNTYFDITGGMGSIVTLASRLVPTQRDGEWGYWAKSATTGKWRNLTEGKFGQRTALDYLEGFFEGKLSPGAGIFRDVWRGENFQGEKPTIDNVLKGILIPLPVQSALQRKEVEDLASPQGLAGLILEGLGLSASTYEKKK